MVNAPPLRHVVRQHLDSRVLLRLRLFLLIIVVMAGIVVYDIYLGVSELVFFIPILIIGFGVGLFSSRMTKLSWNKEKGKVVGQMDAIGIVVLVVYIGIEASREWILSQWVEGLLLSALGFAFIGAAMAGRFYQMRINILKILTGEQKLN